MPDSPPLTPFERPAAPVPGWRRRVRWQRLAWIGVALAGCGLVGAALLWLQLAALWNALVVVASVGAVLSGLAGYWNTYRTVKSVVPVRTGAISPVPVDALRRLPAAADGPNPTQGVAVHGDRPEPAPSPRHNIPASWQPLVGRQRERTELQQRLAEQRLVTLKAMGGIGKTRLALELARDAVSAALPPYAAVWFIDLSNVADNARVGDAILTALGLHTAPGLAATGPLAQALGTGHQLLILDNCEQVVAGVAELAGQLLSRCANLHLLCTSREVLNIPGESVYALPVLTEAEAVELFMLRAHAAQPGFHLAEGQAPLLNRLLQRLDGISLAIELAAARLRSLSLADIVLGLDDSVMALGDGRRGTLPRQQTLQALIDWSYQLLSEPEQRLFRRLAVFQGPFDLAQVRAVCCSLPPLEPGQAPDLLGHLVDKSLLMFDVAAGSAERSSYFLFESLSAFALLRLQATAEEDPLRAAHARHHADWADQARQAHEGADWPQWQARLRTSQANFHAALQWSLAEGHDRRAGQRIAAGLLHHWVDSGQCSAALHWQTLALQHSDDAEPLLRARLQYALGGTCLVLGRLHQASELLRACCTEFERHAEALGELGIACNDLAVALSDGGGSAEPAALYTRAAAIAERTDNPRRQAEAIGNLALELSDQGRFDQADAALAGLLQQLGAQMSADVKVYCLRNRALLALRRNDAAAAKAQIDQALALLPDMGENPQAILEWVTAMRIEAALGHWPAAAALARRALAMQAQQPQNRHLPLFCEGMACLAERHGDALLSARWWGLATRLRRDMQQAPSTLARQTFERSWQALQTRLEPAAAEHALAEGHQLDIASFLAQAEDFSLRLSGSGASDPR